MYYKMNNHETHNIRKTIQRHKRTMGEEYKTR